MYCVEFFEYLQKTNTTRLVRFRANFKKFSKFLLIDIEKTRNKSVRASASAQNSSILHKNCVLIDKLQQVDQYKSIYINILRRQHFKS